MDRRVGRSATPVAAGSPHPAATGGQTSRGPERSSRRRQALRGLRRRSGVLGDRSRSGVRDVDRGDRYAADPVAARRHGRRSRALELHDLLTLEAVVRTGRVTERHEAGGHEALSVVVDRIHQRLPGRVHTRLLERLDEGVGQGDSVLSVAVEAVLGPERRRVLLEDLLLDLHPLVEVSDSGAK